MKFKMGYSTIYRLFEIFGWLILRCLDGWTLGVDPSLKLTDFESPLQGGNLESGGSRLGRPYTKKWGKYKLPYPKFHRFCYKTVLQISHNHLLFSHNIVWFWYTPILMIWNINGGKNLENISFLKSLNFLAFLHISCYKLIGWTLT